MVQEYERNTRNPLGPFSWGCRVRGGASSDCGGPVRRGSPAPAGRGVSRGYGPSKLAPKATGRWGDVYPGLGLAGLHRRDDGGEVERRVAGGGRGGGCCRASPGLLIRQGEAQPCCEQEPRVSEARGSPATRNRHGGRHLTSGGAGAIPVLQAPRSSVGTPGRFQPARRSFCGGLQGRRWSEAARPRQRRGLARRAERGAAS